MTADLGPLVSVDTSSIAVDTRTRPPTSLPSLAPSRAPTPVPTVLLEIATLQESYSCSVDTVSISWNMSLEDPSAYCGTASLTLIAEDGATTPINDGKELVQGLNTAQWSPDNDANYCPGDGYRIRLRCSVVSNYGPYYTTYFNPVSYTHLTLPTTPYV